MIFNVAWCNFAEIVVFSNKEKAAIKNDFLERRWNDSKICMEHSPKSWNRVSVYRQKRFQEDNSMDRRPGSGRQRTITTIENKRRKFLPKKMSQEGLLVATCPQERLN